MKARLLSERGKLKDARRLLEQMAVENPSNPMILNNLGNVLLEMNKDLDHAQECFAEAADLDPHSTTALHNLITLNKRKKDLDFVLELCDICLKRDPLDVEALLDKAMIYGMRGNLEEAEQYVSKVLQLDPENEDGAKVTEALNEFRKKLCHLKM
jgi:tetratricopeptide (TPR) repeat protein